MTDDHENKTIQDRLQKTIIEETVRSVLELPQYAGADSDFVRELVEGEIKRGNITLYGMLRSIRMGSGRGFRQ